MGTHVWLAGLAQAADPNAFHAQYARLEPVLGPTLNYGPGTCYTGTPAPFDGPKYLLVIIAGSKAELDQLVAKAGEPILFESKATQMCVD